VTNVTPTPASTSNEPLDLETRIANRKRQLIAEIVECKRSSRSNAVETGDKLKARLSELAHIVKEGVVDGWANVGARARLKLEAWLAR